MYMDKGVPHVKRRMNPKKGGLVVFLGGFWVAIQAFGWFYGGKNVDKKRKVVFQPMGREESLQVSLL